jgi:hypothetical protein
MLMESLLLREVQVNVRCAMRATRITGPNLFYETINSHRHMRVYPKYSGLIL